jgi:phosphoserine phosphatase
MTPKLVAFDFDSTLMDGETIDILADAAGVGHDVARVTEATMRGELDFFGALQARVRLLRGLPYAQVLDICRALPLMPGAKETVAALKARGCRVVVFSGGFREATAHHAAYLGADADFANFLHQQSGALTGLVGGEMMTSDAKGSVLARLQALLGILPGETVAVGDGANDLSLFARAGLKVAFRAKPILRAAADVCVEEKDLRALLEVLPGPGLGR